MTPAKTNPCRGALPQAVLIEINAGDREVTLLAARFALRCSNSAHGAGMRVPDAVHRSLFLTLHRVRDTTPALVSKAGVNPRQSDRLFPASHF
jgi:hypothetical protein